MSLPSTLALYFKAAQCQRQMQVSDINFRQVGQSLKQNDI